MYEISNYFTRNKVFDSLDIEESELTYQCIAMSTNWQISTGANSFKLCESKKVSIFPMKKNGQGKGAEAEIKI